MPLTIKSKTKIHHFTVEVAATPEEQEKGLMFRRSLAGDRGMIFPYDPPQEVAFWMKNTLIPLDIIYIRSDGTIVRITKAEAMDLTAAAVGRADHRSAGNSRRPRRRARHPGRRYRQLDQVSLRD